MSASAIEATRRLVGRQKESLIENAAVIMATLSVMISAFSLLLGGVALYATFSARLYTQAQIQDLSEDIGVYRIRAAKMDAWLKVHGVPTEEIYDD